MTVFVVATGSSLARLNPSDDFVVLSAALIVVAVIMTGGLTPGLSARTEEITEDDIDDPAYN